MKMLFGVPCWPEVKFPLESFMAAAPAAVKFEVLEMATYELC